MVQEQNDQQTNFQILDNGTIFNTILALFCPIQKPRARYNNKIINKPTFQILKATSQPGGLPGGRNKSDRTKKIQRKT